MSNKNNTWISILIILTFFRRIFFCFLFSLLRLSLFSWGIDVTTAGTRTLNAVRSSQYQQDYHPNNTNMWHRTSAGRSSNNSGGTASSKERHQTRSNNFLATAVADNGATDDLANEFDTVSNASSEGVRAINYNPDMVLFKAQRDHQSDGNAQNSASSGDSSVSMLVAEHGFVRFRPMENIPKDKKETKPSNSDNNNKNSPAIMQRHHKRSLTNS